MDFASRYEIARTAKFIRSRGYKRVALQFPDELLEDAMRVEKALRAELGKDAGLYVMADTAYGSCCVDEVAASHVDADCVVHYGHACCSPTSTLPVLFVFRKMPINVHTCTESLYKCLASSKKPILVLFGLEFSYVIHAIIKEMVDKISESGNTSTEATFAEVSCFNIDPPDHQSNSQDESSASSSYSLGGLTWNIPAGRRMEEYLLFWIGSDNPAFMNVTIMFNSCETVRYEPKENRLLEDQNINRKILNRRYYLVERAKDANIVGILVGTLGIAGYLHMVQKVKKLIESAGKRSYTLVMGRPSPAKLANFPECDVFVYVSCAQTALLDSKEFLAPVITPFEAVLAFQRGSRWTGEYVIEFRNLMRFSDLNVLDGQEDEARFSFFKGGYVQDTRREEDGDEQALAELTHKALSLRKDDADSILFKGKAQSGAEFLAARSYSGLSLQCDDARPRSVVVGRAGRAAGYDHEKLVEAEDQQPPR